MATMKPSPRPFTMRAVRIHEYGDAGKLRLEESPRPAIQQDQVLVKVRYAGLNPIDWKIRSGQAKSFLHTQFPYIVGQDFAGEVAKAETESKTPASPFTPGERVFGFADGTYAEYVAASLAAIATMPPSMDFAEAAALPTAGCTALQIVRDLIRAQRGMKILIHAAAGGVGSFASQIAKDRGADVIGTATSEDLSYLRTLGIVGVIDYKRDRFEQKVGDLDAVVDLVGGDTLERSYGVLKRGGALVTTVGTIDEVAAQRAGLRAFRMVMKRSAADLRELAKLVERGAVKPRIGRILELDQAIEAQELSEAGRTRGKVLLKV